LQGKRLKQIEEEVEVLLRHFIEDLSALPKARETYYDSTFTNMVRRERAVRRKSIFKRFFLRNAPRVDEQGFIVTEVASWTRFSR